MERDPAGFSMGEGEARTIARTNMVVNLGLVVNILLAFAKVITGIVSHSQALLADGINSMSDVAYYTVIRVFMRLAHKPADKEHPFGHRQFETIAAVIVGAFVVTTGITVFWDSVRSAYGFLTGQVERQPVLLFALWIALATVVIKIFLTIYTTAMAKKSASAAIMALAHDHRNDIFSASAAAVGIAFGSTGFAWVDPVAGALVSLVIFRTGIRILQESSSELMDKVPTESVSRQVKEIAAEFPEIKDLEEIHAHRFGPYLVINITIGIDGSLPVRRGDEIATALEDELSRRMSLLRRAYIHYHPAH